MSDGINKDKLVRAISLLEALRSSIQDREEYADLTTSHVNEYHERLASISEIGIEEFLIPESEIKPRIVSSHFDGSISSHRYSDEKYVRKSIFLTKLDGILNYLYRLLNEPPRNIGYKTNK